MLRKYLHIFILLVFLPTLAVAQKDSVFVQKITIEGNRKTKDRIILRELDFKIGDGIPLSELTERIEINKRNILNTALFSSATFNIKDWNHSSNEISFTIEVQENWYIYPIVVMELADRNFNVWWQEQKRDFNRINFGMDAYHINLTGRKDRLKLGLLFGYKQKYELAYEIPYINKQQTIGFKASTYYSRRKEIAYQTLENKLAFDRNEDEFQLYRFRAGTTFIYRKGIKFYHRAKLEYQQNSISDRVAFDLNPDYFLNNKKRQQLFFLRYEFTIDERDVRPYPLSGRRFLAIMEKEGLGIFKDRNGLAFSVELEQYFKLNKKFSFGTKVKGKTQVLRKKQAYTNYYALGYISDYLRGYELYVVDGLDYGYLQTTLRYELFNFEWNWGKAMPIKQFKKMPARIYLIFYNDTGYVHDNQYANTNPLGNEWMYGSGIGLDFVVYYDKILQFQFSRNHLNEYGLFIHNQIFF